MLRFSRVNVRVAAFHARPPTPTSEGRSLRRDPSTDGSLGLITFGAVMVNKP